MTAVDEEFRAFARKYIFNIMDFLNNPSRLPLAAGCKMVFRDKSSVSNDLIMI
jgi:hypothetical protein